MTIVSIQQLPQKEVLQFFLRNIGERQKWLYLVVFMTVAN